MIAFIISLCKHQMAGVSLPSAAHSRGQGGEGTYSASPSAEELLVQNRAKVIEQHRVCVDVHSAVFVQSHETEQIALQIAFGVFDLQTEPHPQPPSITLRRAVQHTSKAAARCNATYIEQRTAFHERALCNARVIHSNVEVRQQTRELRVSA
jgi:hypothetical protein